ncbi:hypothetical protein D0469_04780, partial [Peribacillus saganii]
IKTLALCFVQFSKSNSNFTCRVIQKRLYYLNKLKRTCQQQLYNIYHLAVAVLTAKISITQL